VALIAALQIEASGMPGDNLRIPHIARTNIKENPTTIANWLVEASRTQSERSYLQQIIGRTLYPSAD
jgi:hypothetical protein